MQTAVSQAELDVREIENLVKGGASSCYRLLRYLNSAAFGFANEIDSLRHALAILGEREVRRWIWLVATLDWTRQDHRPGALGYVVRARFCELVSPKIPHGDSDLFLMGILSMMDVILEIPISQVLDKFPSIRRARQCCAAAPAVCARSINSCWPKSPASGRPPVNWPRNSISPKAKSRSITGKPYNAHAK
jgi:c-di-GMP-related signal transduction protein